MAWERQEVVLLTFGAAVLIASLVQAASYGLPRNDEPYLNECVLLMEAL